VFEEIGVDPTVDRSSVQGHSRRPAEGRELNDQGRGPSATLVLATLPERSASEQGGPPSGGPRSNEFGGPDPEVRGRVSPSAGGGVREQRVPEVNEEGPRGTGIRGAGTDRRRRSGGPPAERPG
jgi:hypothetical protein